MTKYILVDAANLFYRCRHVTQGDAFTKAGMSLHLIFRSMRKVWREFKGEHFVCCLEGGSWRTELHPEYKAHRRVAKLQLTTKEREEEEVFRQTFDDLTRFISEHSRITVLHSPGIEGDDFVARWIQLHPTDEHVILSGDSDFVQLLAPNVTIYDGIRDHLITTAGVTNAEGVPLEFAIKSDSKLKIGKANPEFRPEERWWERALFTKIVRGDSGDNIFSAYPKVRATKLREAYDDRAEQGYAWNNFMLQTWINHLGKEVRVLDAFAANERLIDLTKQPEHVREIMDTVIVQAVQKEPVTNVGVHFLRFCERNSLPNLSREAADHAAYLNAAYR
jgi:hypothetical protein